MPNLAAWPPEDAQMGISEPLPYWGPEKGQREWLHHPKELHKPCCIRVDRNGYIHHRTPALSGCVKGVGSSDNITPAILGFPK